MTMLKTAFEEIVDVNAIGKEVNTRKVNDLLQKAWMENLKPAHEDTRRVLALLIDPQLDFMENGALGVAGSIKDTENTARFIYNNMDQITKITVSIDTHNPFQIFHPCWWVDQDGKNPPPFTAITLDDLDQGKWIPVLHAKKSREYVLNLEKNAKKTLVIWPYHCLQGTVGNAVENQLANLIYFHSVARKTVLQKVVKGTDPLSEMYGIIKPEYDTKNYINIDLLNEIEKYEMIVVAGQAKSHCVLESVKQILEHYSSRPEVTSKLYILEDCMSSIGGFEAATEAAFNQFKLQYKINLVKSTDLVLK
ncbi:MAG: hypothetical protein N2645_13675 [Clostridia bacterium]|nr:hypothetical protein [Clostridia bacterium]